MREDFILYILVENTMTYISNLNIFLVRISFGLFSKVKTIFLPLGIYSLHICWVFWNKWSTWTFRITLDIGIGLEIKQGITPDFLGIKIKPATCRRDQNWINSIFKKSKLNQTHRQSNKIIPFLKFEGSNLN